MSQTPSPTWRTDENAETPATFIPSQWRILKTSGSLIAAQNLTTGEQRKLPRAWFE